MTMDFLSSIVDKMEQTKVDLEMVCESKSVGEKVEKIDPDQIGLFTIQLECTQGCGDWRWGLSKAIIYCRL